MATESKIIFNELTLQNFKIFDQEKIVFSPKTLFIGKNGAGKTSILEAIKWVWYGKYISRNNIEVPSQFLINIDAVKNKDRVLSVSLEFSYNGEKYLIRRQIEIDDTQDIDDGIGSVNSYLRNLTEDQIKTEFSMKINGNSISDQEGEKKLGEFMPEEVADFFLFDGEKLDRYEKLIQDEQSQSKFIIESIEKILGIPAVGNAKNDLDKMKTTAQKDLNKNAQAQISNKVQLGYVTKANMEIDKQNQKKQKHVTNIDNINLKNTELEQKLSQNKTIIDKLSKRQNLQDENEKNNEELDKVIASIKELSSDSWRILLQEKVEKISKDKIAEIKNKKSKFDKQAQQLVFNEFLQNATVGNECPICSNHLNESHKSIIKKKQTVPIDQDLNLNTEIVHLEEKLDRLDRDKYFTNINSSEISSLEEKKNSLKAKISSNEGEIKDITKILSGSDQPDVQKTQNELTNNIMALGVSNNEIKKIDQEIEKQTKTLMENQAKINQDIPNDEPLKKYVDILASLFTIFDKSMKQIIEDSRDIIEKTANSAFKNINTNENYESLQINENFGLKIIRSDGIEVPLRSAGTEQLVSLALLTSLNQNAVNKAPLVMDTTFGRLDKDNTLHSIKHLIDLPFQTILLIHDDEVNEETLEEVSNLFEQKYVINKNPSQELSSIEEKK